MYKVLIADDEEIIRRGIASLLKKDNDVQVVAMAEDGEDALELAKEHNPDILLVDINMPFMNGLEFIKKLNECMDDPVIIVITGYDDFAHVQMALKLKVFDYLLKPITEKSFYSSINKAKEHFNKKSQKNKYYDWACMQLEKNKPVIISQFLNNWLNDNFTKSEIIANLEYFSIKVADQFALALVKMSDENIAQSYKHEWDDNLLFYAAENITGELFQEFTQIISCCDSCGYLVVLAFEPEKNQWENCCDKLKNVLEKYLPIKVTIVQEAQIPFDDIINKYSLLLEEFKTQSKYSHIISEMKKYAEENYMNYDISLQEIAKIIHFSPQHISRAFRQETGITFTDYLTKVRIRKAIELLAKDDIKIYEISELVGYSSQHYFCNAFKRVLGISPMEYKKSKLNKND